MIQQEPINVKANFKREGGNGVSQQIIESVRETFEALYKTDPVDYYFSPGRINLIGEHTDYNGGRVFPCAITQGTYGAVKLRQD